MSLLSWIIFGLIVGAVANIIDPRPSQGGVLAAIALGIGGALIGGFLGMLILGIGISGFSASSFLLAILGSLILLMVERELNRA